MTTKQKTFLSKMIKEEVKNYLNEDINDADLDKIDSAFMKLEEALSDLERKNPESKKINDIYSDVYSLMLKWENLKKTL